MFEQSENSLYKSFFEFPVYNCHFTIGDTTLTYILYCLIKLLSNKSDFVLYFTNFLLMITVFQKFFIAIIIKLFISKDNNSFNFGL